MLGVDSLLTDGATSLAAVDEDCGLLEAECSGALAIRRVCIRRVAD